MKQRIFRSIVRKRRPIVAIYVIAAVICLALRQFVGVNYDLTSYLPADAPSTVALDTMDDQFAGNIPNARVMVEGVSIPQALEVKHRIEQVKGVESVLWLDDSGATTVPLEMQDTSAVENYYKDDCALFTVTIDPDHQIEATEEIRDIIGEEGALTGAAASNALATTSTEQEIGVITVLAVAVILLVLVITTTSWAEPFLVLAGLGIAVFINWGTNLMFGEISFVSNSAGSVLQIAIALDFSVFLLHRYAEVRGTHASAEEDMVEALDKSSVAIISSGCTVTIGFLALCAMRYQLGSDLGLVLAKGILISLLTVFTFTPSLLVCANGLIERTQHRAWLPNMRGFAKLVLGICVPAACALALVCVPARLASTSPDIEYWYGTSHIFGQNTQLGQDQERIARVFGESDTYALMVPSGNTAEEVALSHDLQQIDGVSSVLSYVDVASPLIPAGMAEQDVIEQVRSDDYSRFVITVDAPIEGESTFELVEQIRDAAEKHYPGTYELAGEGVSTKDLRDTITVDKDTVDLIAVAAVFVVLLVATRSISLPVLLVLVIETSIWCNFSLPLMTHQPVFFISYLIVSSIQLGVAVDYAILIADRYRECRETMSWREALSESIAACTVPVLTSGSVLVAVGFLISAISTHGILMQLGWYLGTGVLMSLAAVLFALPGFLRLFDGLIARTTMGAHFLNIGKNAPGRER